MGYSGESTWCIKTALATYQTQATQLFGKSITHWTLDAGTGMVSGVKGVTKQEEEQEDNSKDVDAKGDGSEDEEGAHGAWPAYQDAEEGAPGSRRSSGNGYKSSRPPPHCQHFSRCLCVRLPLCGPSGPRTTPNGASTTSHPPTNFVHKIFFDRSWM